MRSPMTSEVICLGTDGGGWTGGRAKRSDDGYEDADEGGVGVG